MKGVGKIVGLVIIVLTIKDFPEYFGEVLKLRDIGISYLILYWVPIAFSIVFGFSLILFSDILDLWIYKSRVNRVKEIGASCSVLVMLLGLYLLSSSLSDFSFHISNYFYTKSMSGYEEFSISSYNYPYFIATAIELLFSFLVLYLGYKGTICPKSAKG